MSGPKGFGPAPPTKLFAGNVIGPLRARTVPGPSLPAVLVESEPGGNADGPIEPGARLSGRITHEGYEHLPFEITIDRIEPERVFAFRWHPFAVEPNVDYSSEPTTLIEFTLADAQDGTMLTVTESGFDQIPLERRAQAFASNDQGWAMVMTLIEKHLTHGA